MAGSVAIAPKTKRLRLKFFKPFLIKKGSSCLRRNIRMSATGWGPAGGSFSRPGPLFQGWPGPPGASLLLSPRLRCPARRFYLKLFFAGGQLGPFSLRAPLLAGMRRFHASSVRDCVQFSSFIKKSFLSIDSFRQSGAKDLLGRGSVVISFRK